jgi:DNA-binding NtrC family response regulator
MPDGANGKKSIMIVDDEPDICTILKNSLDGNGFAVSTFTNPALALEHFKLEPERYDAVISDVRMPQMSGFELAREIRSLNPKTKIVVMTAFEINKSEFEKVLPSSSIDEFLTKPVSAAAMRQTVEKL